MQVSNLYIQYVCVYIKVIVLMCMSIICPSIFHHSDTADATCPQRHRGQRLGRVHQITPDLLSEHPGVCPSVPQPFSSVYSAVRSVFAHQLLNMYNEK